MKLRFTIHPRELLFAFFLFMLPFSVIFETGYYGSNIAYLAYTDEVLCIVCAIYTVYFIFKNGIKGTNLAILGVLIVLILWGMYCNIYSGVIKSWFPIIVDAVCLAKIFIPFIIYRQVAVFDKKRMIARYLVLISKLMLIAATVCGIISQFVYIGMSIDPQRRYGILPFSFVFRNEGRFGYIAICALIFIMLVEKSKRKTTFYELCAIMCVLFTTKGVVYIVVACYIILLIIWRKNTKLTLPKVSLLAIGGIAVSTTQINTYLRDYNSPRVTLIRYGITTAKRYFPFGSGFATYGSDQAMKNYSSLYYLYGFDNRWGLSPDNPAFLNDCYLGMLFGQFGFFGTVLFFVLIILTFIPIKNIVLDKKVKAISLALFIGIVVSAIGTAIIKSSVGVYIFAVLGLVCGYSEQNFTETTENNSQNYKAVKRLKIKVRSK